MVYSESDDYYFLHCQTPSEIIFSFFPALDIPVSRHDVESNVKQSLQETSYQLLEIWQHWTPTQ